MLIKYLVVVQRVNDLPPLESTLEAFEADDCLELDELWSFVKRRKNKCWRWMALCRRTRQIVSYTIGCRGEKTCQVLWDRIPSRYKDAHCYSDRVTFGWSNPKIVVLPITSKGSIAPSDKEWDVGPESRFPFPKSTSCMRLLRSSSFITTMHLSTQCEPLPDIHVTQYITQHLPPELLERKIREAQERGIALLAARENRE